MANDVVFRHFFKKVADGSNIRQSIGLPKFGLYLGFRAFEVHLLDENFDYIVLTLSTMRTAFVQGFIRFEPSKPVDAHNAFYAAHH